MTRGLAALAALVILCAASPRAWACPPPSDEVLFHSCWGSARLTVALLPEDLPLPPAGPGRSLAVTGAYTATDTRDGGLPKPVGLFVHGGRVVNPNLGRMDGVLIADPSSGTPELQHRTRLAHGGKVYDLTVLDQRRAFMAAAAADGVSVLQSHLLIVDGQIDVMPQDGAPVFVRRILFADGEGFGVFQTSGAETLRGAAELLARSLSPRMAMNLDMGSYDFCLKAEAGFETPCGFLGRGDTAKLSNLLLLTPR